MVLDECTKKQIIELVSNLIKIKSYSGEEKDIAEYIQNYMLKNGYDSAIIDKYGSVIGCINGKKNGKSVLLDGHIDTVRADDENLWQHPPFSGETFEDKMYGRGASDMKGSVACMIVAASLFAKKCNKDFSGKVYVSCTVHEECFEGISSLSVAKIVKPDFVIIGEATQGTLKVGQRGRTEIELKTIGKSCHSSNPSKGINAVYAMCDLINFIKEIKPNEEELLGKGILELTDIVSSPYPGSSVVPSLCTATYDRRLILGEDEKLVLEQLDEAISKCKDKNPNIGVESKIRYAEEKCWTGEIIKSKRFFSAWSVPVDSEIVVKSSKGLSKANLKVEISHFDFCTNGSGFAGMLNIPCIGYGPSLESLAHVRDEYIRLDDMYNAVRGYQSIIFELLG